MSRDGNWTCIAYGGVGNPNGGDVWGRNSGGFWNGSSYYNANRPSGTGGLLILYSDNLYNNGTISSNGVNNVSNKYGDWSIGGGASGGGSVNIFANKIVDLGSMTAIRRSMHRSKLPGRLRWIWISYSKRTCGRSNLS